MDTQNIQLNLSTEHAAKPKEVKPACVLSHESNLNRRSASVFRLGIQYHLSCMAECNGKRVKKYLGFEESLDKIYGTRNNLTLTQKNTAITLEFQKPLVSDYGYHHTGAFSLKIAETNRYLHFSMNKIMNFIEPPFVHQESCGTENSISNTVALEFRNSGTFGIRCYETLEEGKISCVFGPLASSYSIERVYNKEVVGRKGNRVIHQQPDQFNHRDEKKQEAQRCNNRIWSQDVKWLFEEILATEHFEC